MSLTSLIGVGFAVAGALVALIWLPDRATDPSTTAVQAMAPTAGAVASLEVVAG